MQCMQSNLDATLQKIEVQSTLALRTPHNYGHRLVRTKFRSQQKRFDWKQLPLLRTLAFKDTKQRPEGVRYKESGL